MFMKVENKKMKRMETLFRKIRKGGLNPTELKELAELGAYFLYIGKASEYLS
jgi:hypothetical protein